MEIGDRLVTDIVTLLNDLSQYFLVCTLVLTADVCSTTHRFTISIIKNVKIKILNREIILFELTGGCIRSGIQKQTFSG